MQGSEPRGSQWDVLGAIALGGMIGATARYKLATWITVPAGTFPWATFWTNLSGSFVLGFLLVLLLERFPPTRYARAFAGTGVLGAYTTFSTFSVETDVLIKDGHVGTRRRLRRRRASSSGIAVGVVRRRRRPARPPSSARRRERT